MPFEAVNALNYSGHYPGERLHEAATSLDNYGIELVPFGSVGPIAEITNTVASQLMRLPTSHLPLNETR